VFAVVNVARLRWSALPMTPKALRPTSLIVLALALSACARSSIEDGGTFVVARVNGSDILSQQVSGLAERRDGTAEAPGEPPAGDALERVIDEELLVQQALRGRLDRDPVVSRAIEAARRQILARAYVDRAAQAAPAQSAHEIRAFYRDYPALFEQRRVYSVNQLVVAAGPERIGELLIAVQRASSMSEVARWLNAQQLPFHAEVVSRSAEHIPLGMLSQLYELRDGQIAVVAGSPGISIVQLLRAENAPLSEAQAEPIIAGYLSNRRRLEVSRAEIGRLRAQAFIEYVRKFAPMHAGLR
jgi:EpsD family peptidyl-prolyl cis-trans isomerase